MHNNIKDDYEFFKKAVLSVSSSLDLSKAMITVFEFLRHYFPLEGLSLHTLNPDMNALHLLFLVTQEGFHNLDDLVPLQKADVRYLLSMEKNLESVLVPHSVERPVSVRHSAAISRYLPNRDRSYMVAILSSKKTAVGHLCLIGKKPKCFTRNHVQRLSILVPLFSLVMMNLLQHRKVKKLQEQLIEEKKYLKGKVRQLSKKDIIGAQSGLKEVMEMVEQLTGRDVPVLITGETGSGKEIIADAVQRVSDRYDSPYIKVNCGAIPESLIDSELFGHEKGAFTSALTRRPGRFEQADGGTLFLDEIGDMAPRAQTRLLRVIQDGVVERVGSHRSIRVNVRIIAATNQNLRQKVADTSFRQDLFYRLNVFPIVVPPLRERPEDIPALVHYFIKKKAKKLKCSTIPRVAPDTLEALASYPWPGNVRELENLVERAMIIDPSGPLKLQFYLPQVNEQPGFIQQAQPQQRPVHAHSAPKDSLVLDDIIRRHIQSVLARCNGIINGPAGAARVLGINPNTLRKRMDKLNIPYGRKRLAKQG
jgi:transcriptional regulator with GAF, ATPase, and Fis domain